MQPPREAYLKIRERAQRNETCTWWSSVINTSEGNRKTMSLGGFDLKYELEHVTTREQ
jgi:hypothetical protein